jgi:hypothetical protein
VEFVVGGEVDDEDDVVDSLIVIARVVDVVDVVVASVVVVAMVVVGSVVVVAMVVVVGAMFKVPTVTADVCNVVPPLPS